MASVLTFMQDVAWLMKNAALRKDVPVLSWATVVNGTPGVTVMLDGTTTARQVSGNAVGPLSAGQRVRVEIQGTRVTILAAPTEDTGWQPLPLLSGFTPGGDPPRIRRLGPWVSVRGEVVRTAGGISDATWVQFATLPEHLRFGGLRRTVATSHPTSTAAAIAMFHQNDAGAFFVGRAGGSTGATFNLFILSDTWIAAT